MRIRAGALAVSLGLTACGAIAADAPSCPKQLVDKPQVDPATGKETAAGREARTELEMVANVLVVYRGCARDVPEFEKRFGADFQAWRTKYGDALARYERNPHARRYVECGLEHERRRVAAESPAGRAEKAELCLRLMGPRIEAFTKQGPR